MCAAAFFGRVDDFEWLPLRFSHFQRKIILNFGISERLRAFRYPIFTEGVVEENCLSTVALFHMKKGEDAIRSAALSQKAALQMPFAATPPSREKVNRENPQIFPIYK